MATDLPAKRRDQTTPRNGTTTPDRPVVIGQVDLVLTRCVDAGLAGVILVVPLVMGGRQALGQLVLVALAVWVATCWCLRQSLVPRAAWIHSPAEPFFLAALAWVVLQLVALPPAVLDSLSRHVYETLPLWAPHTDASATLGVWNTLSLTPEATRQGLILLAAGTLLFLVTVERVRHVEDVERLLRWVAVATFVMAAFGLVQYFTTNGKFFWFYEHPFTDTKRFVKGAFTNKNHFAHFIALGFGSLVWWVQSSLYGNSRSRSMRRRYHRRPSNRQTVQTGLKIVALALCAFAALMSFSRGGTLALFAAGLLCLLMLYRGSLIGGKSALTLAGTGLLVAAGLCVFGYDVLAARLDDFGSIEDLDRRRMRRNLWQADLRGIADYPIVGAGVGSHREVYPMYLETNKAKENCEYTHAENGYVQVSLEAGLPGLLIALVGIGLFGYWCLAPLIQGVSRRVLLCLAAIAPCLAASVVHSIGDFVWYVPGCMVIVVILAACACRLWQMAREEAGRPTPRWQVPRAGWAAATLGLAVVGGFMLSNRLAAARAEPHWHRYLVINNTFVSSNDEELDRTGMLRAMAQELSTVVKLQPNHARAHAMLALAHLRAFREAQRTARNAFDLRQIREAALDSSFKSSDALHQWLSKAIGPPCKHLTATLEHAHRAVSLCPLRGEAYTYLAQLAFLEGPNSPGKSAYVDQAFKVRPFDGDVLFAVGYEAVLANDLDRVCECWRASFHCGRLDRQRLLDLSVGHAPVQDLLEIFQPDLQGLRHMTWYYRRINRTGELSLLLARLAEACTAEAGKSKGAAAARSWLEAANAYQELNRFAEQLQCLRNAIRCQSSNYDARLALGKCCYELSEFAEAEKHLIWCSRRKPRDGNLRALLEDAVEKRLRETSRPVDQLEARLPRPPARN